MQAAAARAVGRGAPESAVAYLRRAVAETADVSLRAMLSRELGRSEKVLGDPAAAEHLRESLRLSSDPSTRAAVAPDLAELLVLAGQWEACTGIIREALAELADRRVPSGGSSGVAVARLQSWWAGLSAYDPILVGELDHRLDELRAAARGSDVASRMLAGLLAGVLAWRGEQGDTVLALLDHALDHGRLLARVDSDPLMAAQALFSPIMLEQLGRAEELADQLLAQSRSRGSVVGLVIAACMHAAVGARRGELVSVETDVRTLVEIAAEYGMAFVIPSALWYGADALIERPGLADVAKLADVTALAPDLRGPRAGRCFERFGDGSRSPPVTSAPRAPSCRRRRAPTRHCIC